MIWWRRNGMEGARGCGVVCIWNVLVVQDIRRHHEAEFRVLVGLGTNEIVTVKHGDRVLAPCLQPGMRWDAAWCDRV